MTPPDRFNFSAIEWQLDQACEMAFWIQPTTTKLNAAMDAAARSLTQRNPVDQVVADLHAAVAALDVQYGAVRPPTRDMMLDLISRISGIDQKTLLTYWLAAGDKAKGSPGEKAFRTLQARVALAGMQLIRSDARDGPQRLFLTRQGVVRELVSIDDLEALIAHLGG